MGKLQESAAREQQEDSQDGTAGTREPQPGPPLHRVLPLQSEGPWPLSSELTAGPSPGSGNLLSLKERDLPGARCRCCHVGVRRAKVFSWAIRREVLKRGLRNLEYGRKEAPRSGGGK